MTRLPLTDSVSQPSLEITMIEAITQALAYALHHDPDVVLLGEDIGVNGGVFRATAGLQERFGAERVIDTPLAEVMIAGLTVGMATQGLRPVAEFQFEGFIHPAIDHICNHAARMRNRTRGRLSCPAVFRAPWGGGIHAPEHHSDSPEAIFCHTPGLKVVIPSSPKRAYGLLLAALRDPDPVVFFEPKRIYRQHKQVVPDDGQSLPLSQAFVVREGCDLTLLSYGAMVHECLKAAALLETRQGLRAEVLDLATLSPWDRNTVIDSVAKTHELWVIHEAPRSFGVGAEIAAELSEIAAPLLRAPVRRIAGYDTVMPYFKLEHDYLPDAERIAERILSTRLS